MSNHRALLFGVGVALTVLGTLVTPVAAATTKLTVVNGHPGTRVDVCVQGREIKSGLRYGGVVFRTTNTAFVVVKLYKRDPRPCGGRPLGQARSALEDLPSCSPSGIRRRSWRSTTVSSLRRPTHWHHAPSGAMPPTSASSGSDATTTSMTRPNSSHR